MRDHNISDGIRISSFLRDQGPIGNKDKKFGYRYGINDDKLKHNSNTYLDTVQQVSSYVRGYVILFVKIRELSYCTVCI